MKLLRVLLFLGILGGCDGGAGGDGGPTTAAGSGGAAECTGNCAASMPTNLTVAEVNRIVSQAVLEAQARGAAATIAVSDRVGNILAVYRMTGAAATFTITSGRAVTGGLEGVNIVPSEFAAISKAITGAYLSSEGNAFTTRTASQIVQQNFNPHETNAPGGPLFGVQFSSLSCSDVSWSLAVGGAAGPHGTPLGLSADPGGLPLYKNGTVVGGIGVIADATYSLDLDLRDVDTDLDELIAVAGTNGFNAPNNRRADRITVDGRTLRFTDSEALASAPSAAPAAPISGAFVAVTGYKAAAAPIAGTAFNTTASGYAADSSGNFSGLSAFVLVNGAGTNRYPAIAGTDGLMTQTEVIRVLAETIRVANRTRGQIRLPLGSQAQVNITVVDTSGAILGLIRTPDAPVFGTDVSVQKARTSMFFSRNDAASTLNAQPAFNILTINNGPISQYVTNAQALLGGTAFANGIAYSNLAFGSLNRPFFPDGLNANGPGPFSRAFSTQWSPFNVGIQLDLVGNRVVGNIGAALVSPCSAVSANGIQIFSGGFPIYRGNTLVGGIGISGDGIDQDGLISFLGVHNAGQILATGIGNAPQAIRADTIMGLAGGQLRYINCPIAPFIDSTQTNVCDGL